MNRADSAEGSRRPDSDTVAVVEQFLGYTTLRYVYHPHPTELVLSVLRLQH